MKVSELIELLVAIDDKDQPVYVIHEWGFDDPDIRIEPDGSVLIQ